MLCAVETTCSPFEARLAAVDDAKPAPACSPPRSAAARASSNVALIRVSSPSRFWIAARMLSTRKIVAWLAIWNVSGSRDFAFRLSSCPSSSESSAR